MTISAFLSLRLVVPTDADVGAVRGENSGEDLVLVAQVLVHGIGEVVVRIAAEAAGGAGETAGPLEAHQFLGLLDRQHAQQHLIEEREDRGVGADAEGEREHHGKREGRRLAQLAKCVAKILKQRVHSLSLHGELVRAIRL